MFADDNMLLGDSEEKLERLVQEFGSVCHRRKLLVNETVSEALYYTCRDTLFQDPFWGVSDFPVSYPGYYSFLCFLCGFLIAGVRKTQKDTLKVFIYQNTRHARQQTQGG